MGELDAVTPYVCCSFLNIPDDVPIICILYVFVNPKYCILEVPNWHLKMSSSIQSQFATG